VLRWNGRALEVHLLPAPNYGAAWRQVWEQVLAELNATEPEWPDGSDGGGALPGAARGTASQSAGRLTWPQAPPRPARGAARELNRRSAGPPLISQTEV